MFLHQTDRRTERQKDHLRQKQEKECVRLIMGGDKLDYSGDVVTSTADISQHSNY
jgi:hypothetical protein